MKIQSGYQNKRDPMREQAKRTMGREFDALASMNAPQSVTAMGNTKLRRFAKGGSVKKYADGGYTDADKRFIYNTLAATRKSPETLKKEAHTAAANSWDKHYAKQDALKQFGVKGNSVKKPVNNGLKYDMGIGVGKLPGGPAPINPLQGFQNKVMNAESSLANSAKGAAAGYLGGQAASLAKRGVDKLPFGKNIFGSGLSIGDLVEGGINGAVSGMFKKGGRVRINKEAKHQTRKVHRLTKDQTDMHLPRSMKGKMPPRITVQEAMKRKSGGACKKNFAMGGMPHSEISGAITLGKKAYDYYKKQKGKNQNG